MIPGTNNIDPAANAELTRQLADFAAQERKDIAEIENLQFQCDLAMEQGDTKTAFAYMARINEMALASFRERKDAQCDNAKAQARLNASLEENASLNERIENFVKEVSDTEDAVRRFAQEAALIGVNGVIPEADGTEADAFRYIPEITWRETAEHYSRVGVNCLRQAWPYALAGVNTVIGLCAFGISCYSFFRGR